MELDIGEFDVSIFKTSSNSNNHCSLKFSSNDSIHFSSIHNLLTKAAATSAAASSQVVEWYLSLREGLHL